jgi:hypothetical protein
VRHAVRASIGVLVPQTWRRIPRFGGEGFRAAVLPIGLAARSVFLAQQRVTHAFQFFLFLLVDIGEGKIEFF